MEDSLVHELLSLKLCLYRHELEQVDDNFTKWENQSREKIENSLSQEQLEQVDKYLHNHNLREEGIELQYEIKLLNYGIFLGMQLQKAFEKFPNDLNPPVSL